MFRVALSNNRIGAVAHDQVTFRYKERATGQLRRCTLPAEEFVRRFLQHVLPKGFVKVRYYGLCSPGKRHLLRQLRQLLALAPGTAAAQPARDPPPALTPCPRPEVGPSWGQPLVIAQLLPYRSCSPPRPRDGATGGLS